MSAATVHSAMSIKSISHVRVSRLPKAFDNSISKHARTNRHRQSVIPIQLAPRLGCKAVSYYRDGAHNRSSSMKTYHRPS